MQLKLVTGKLPDPVPEEIQARDWWAALLEPAREDRIYDLTQVLEFYGIDLPDNEDGWIRACWEQEFA